jgi:hypothetical protein
LTAPLQLMIQSGHRLANPFAASWYYGHWIKVKNPEAPAVKREAEEDL